MARDHRRLRVFHATHTLTLAIYHGTKDFPRDEWYGIRAQLRRAAVSTVSNIVEGNARRGTLEYVNFLNIARASAAEVAYLLHLSSELGYFSAAVGASLQRQCGQVIPQLEALIRRMEVLVNEERRTKTKD